MSHHDERRRLPRRRTRLSAAVVHGAEEIIVPCTVRDKSSTGARLLVQAGSEVPDAFYLIELTTGDLHQAKVVWRDGTFVGITFADSCNVAAPKTPEQKRYAELRERLTAKGGR